MSLYEKWIDKIEKLPFDKNYICEVRDKDYIFLVKRYSFSFVVNVFKEKNGKYYLENYNGEKNNFMFIEINGDEHIDIIYRDNETIKNECYATFKYRIYLDEISFYENKELSFDKLRFLKRRHITEKLKHKIIENESNYRCYSRNGKLINEYFLDKDGNKIKTIDYYIRNGATKQIILFKNGEKHCDDGPAVIRYDMDGKIEEKFFYKNGKFIEDSIKPSLIEYIEGKVSAMYFYDEDGQMHRKKLPAFYEFKYDENGKINFIQMEWYENDRINNKNGPAHVKFYTKPNNKIQERYFVEGKKVDDLTAAVIEANTSEHYKKIRQNIIKILKIEEE